MNGTDAERLAIATAFSNASITTGVSLALGAWAGRGNWAALTQQARDRHGAHALAELDTLIGDLTAFRRQLADALGGEPR